MWHAIANATFKMVTVCIIVNSAIQIIHPENIENKFFGFLLITQKNALYCMTWFFFFFNKTRTKVISS